MSWKYQVTANNAWSYIVSAFNAWKYQITAGSFNSTYQAIYDQMTNKPPLGVATAQNTIIETLVDGGVWATRDVFYLLSSHTNDGAEAQLDWINLGVRAAVLHNAPEFDAYEGFRGNAVDAYIDTAFKPSTDGVNFKLDDCSLHFYLRTIGVDTTTKAHIGAIGTTAYIRGYNYTALSHALNNASTEASLLGKASIIGYNRTGSAGYTVYINKAKNEETANSVSLPDYNISLLAENFRGVIKYFGDSQLSFFTAGGSLTDEQEGIMEDAMEAYMQSVGKGFVDITFEGDSLTEGPGTTPYPTQLVAQFLSESVFSIGQENEAVSGDSVEDMAVRGSTTDALKDDQHEYLVVMIGINNFRYSIGGTNEAIYAALKSYCTARKAAGWKTLVLTMTPQDGADTTRVDFWGDRDWYNNQIKTDLLTEIEGVIDITANPLIGLQGSEQNATYYKADKVHLTTAGNTVLADLVYEDLKVRLGL